MKIVLEAETPGDSGTMFRLHIDSALIGESLTAVQAHLLVGEILGRVVHPKSADAQQELSADTVRKMPTEMLEKMPAIPPR